MAVKVFESKKFSVLVEKFNLPNGKVKETAFVNHRGSVVIAPFINRDEVIMIRQYRPIVGSWLIEFPAGTIERNEDPKDTAVRELEEEVGYRAKSIVHLTSFYVSPGVTNEKMHAFIAWDLEYVGEHREDYEVIETIRLKFPEAVEKAKRGEIIDGKTLALILFLYANWEKILTLLKG